MFGKIFLVVKPGQAVANVALPRLKKPEVSLSVPVLVN